MSRNGVLMIAPHNFTAAHDSAALDVIMEAYSWTLDVVKRAAETGTARSLLDMEVAELAPRVR